MSYIFRIVKDQKPLKISIDFTLEEPKGGIHFVVPDIDGTIAERACHLYTYGHENSARLWFPCVDTYSEPCTWKLEITVDASMSAVSSGDLVETIYTHDMKRKTFHYILSIPTAAPNIGLAIGPFEILVDPHMHEVTHFCLPQLLPLLKSTTETTYEIFEFYEEMLSFPFPYSCYKQVFVDEAYVNAFACASLGIFNTNLLHSRIILDQTPASRKLMARTISEQFFGCFMARESWNDIWLPIGIAGYLYGLWIKRTFGNNEYRFWISEENKKLCEYESKNSPVTLNRKFSYKENTFKETCQHPHTISPIYYEMLRRKSHLVIRKIENRIGLQLLLQSFNKLLSLANTSAQQKVPSSTWTTMLLSTEGFLKSIYTVSGKKLNNLFDQWIYQSSVVCFYGSFVFNRKRNAVELELKQDTIGKGAKKYVGPLTVRIQELDGTFHHNIQIEENITRHDIQCHSKSRRNKKKKIPLLNGEEADIDLNSMDPDSPVLWIRIDPDLNLIRSVSFKQPDYMWQYQVKFERDIIGQIEAINALKKLPSQSTRLALADILDEPKHFYQVRMAASFCLASVANSMVGSWGGPPAMMNLFTRLFFCESTNPVVKLNNFSNLQLYFIQKTLPLAMAKLRNEHNICPKEVLHYILDLIKFNDNSKNKYSDNYYRSSIIDALFQTITPTVTSLQGQKITADVIPQDIKIILEEVTRYLNLEKLLPSYRYTVTISCLKILRVLQRNGHLPLDAELFKTYAVVGNFNDVRLSATGCLVDLIQGVKSQETLDWLLDLIAKDNCVNFKWKVLKQLTNCPPFQRQEYNSIMNNSAFVEFLWKFISQTTFYDSRMRCQAIDLYETLFGQGRPKCLPAPQLGVIVNLKERKTQINPKMIQQSNLSDPYQEEPMDTDDFDNSQDGVKLKIKLGSNDQQSPSHPLDISDVLAAESLLSLSHSELRPANQDSNSSVNKHDFSKSWSRDAEPIGVPTISLSGEKRRLSHQFSSGSQKEKKKKKKHKHKHKHKHSRNNDGEISSPASSFVDSPYNLGSPKLSD